MKNDAPFGINHVYVFDPMIDWTVEVETTDLIKFFPGFMGLSDDDKIDFAMEYAKRYLFDPINDIRFEWADGGNLDYGDDDADDENDKDNEKMQGIGLQNEG